MPFERQVFLSATGRRRALRRDSDLWRKPPGIAEEKLLR